MGRASSVEAATVTWEMAATNCLPDTVTASFKLGSSKLGKSSTDMTRMVNLGPPSPEP